ncbi:MAG: alpha-L-rhamnosidase C-terminal domain-containing protein [Verrucomicrobiae bacterium]
MKIIPATILLLPLISAPVVALAQQPSDLSASDPHRAAPIEYPGMTVRVDTNGVQSVGYRFNSDCAKPTPWLAQWIWADAQPSQLAAMFRKTVTLREKPQAVKAWLTADTKYFLYVNGRLVARGPVDIGRDYAGGSTRHWFYDCRDLTPYFVEGTNVVAAVVFQQWPIRFAVSHGQPGFLFEAEITAASGKKTMVASDASWRSLPAGQFLNDTNCDLTKEPTGWRLPGFDDTKWGASQVVTNVWEPLVASEIPPLIEANYPAQHVEGLPQNGIFTNDGHFKVVFDRVLSAYPTLTVKGGAGATVKIQAHRNYSFKLRGGRETLEFPFMDEIAPAYTVELKSVTEPVKVESADAIFTSQPVEYRGEFMCSDEQLNRIWNASRWAVQINLQTHHLDSPNHQEPIGDPGDYLIESMVNHYAFAQPWLTRQDVRKFAWLLKDENYQNFHTSYSIGWLQMLMDYYDYTGDQSLVVEMAPYVHELLDTYTSWRGTNGLISEAPNYMFMDWVTISGFNCHHPPAVIGQGYLTAFYYHGLEMASRVAALTGDTERVEKYKKLRGDITAAFNRELWVADKGLYRDGKPFQTSVKPGRRLPADKDIETYSPHVNLLAVLYDLAPKEKQTAIVEKVMAEKPLNTQPWFMHWVFQAIDRAGLFDQYGTPQMRRWQIVPETQSFREMWNSGDLSHGWCSTPLVQMSQRILGVEPASPGFKTMAIRPHVCDLTWAKGKVPTPRGDVEVSWNWAEDKISLDVTIPDGTEAEVVLPTKTERIPAGHYHFESAYKRAF